VAVSLSTDHSHGFPMLIHVCATRRSLSLPSHHPPAKLSRVSSQDPTLPMGAFVTPTQQPGCAPGPQVALFARVAHVAARLPAAKKDPCVWLPGYAARVRFLGARLRTAHACTLALVVGGWLAREGETFARGKASSSESSYGYIWRWCSLFFPPLAARCSSTPLVRDRRR
jgi:hypothetical protein